MRRSLGMLATGVAGTMTAGLLTAIGAPPGEAALPRLRVSTVVGGLDHPWDVEPLPKGRLLVTERDGRLSIVRAGRKRPVRLAGARILSRGETGLMAVEADPRFRKNRRIYTCQGWSTGGAADVRVTAWKLGPKLRRARLVRTLVSGLPISRSGRHGGCQLLVARDGSLLVGTGDATDEANPRNLSSLGGKTLRLNRFTGAAWRGNPFLRSPDSRTRLIFSYGHRNVQGLTQRPDGTLWSIEQGTNRDDEVNLLVRGGDYGYQPGPGYNEAVPMTNHALPGRQVSARWSSGFPTDATSGGTFLPRKGWRGLNGWLAVAALKNSKLILLKFDRNGRLLAERSRLTGYGRLRTAAVARNGDLLVTTDNGDGRDRILRVRRPTR